jgi:hypothetical protein
MNEVTVDAALRARLNNLDDPLQVRDESGRILGYSHPVVEPAASEATSIRSPSSTEELERRRSQRAGRSLEEILNELNRS